MAIGSGGIGSQGLGSEEIVSSDNEVTFAADSALTANAGLNLEATATLSGDSIVTAEAQSAIVQLDCLMEGGSEIGLDATELGEWGEDSYGGSPYGGLFPPYGIESAIALSNTTVRVRYTAMFDTSFPGLISTSNYSISPPITIFSVVIESAQSVILTVSPLSSVLYTVSISSALGYFNQGLSPFLTETTFMGQLASPTLMAVATGINRVRLVFTDSMLQNSALTDPSYYLVEDLDSNTVLINSVTAEQTSSIRSIILHTATPLVDTKFYKATVLTGVETEDLLSLSPSHSVFQWVETTLSTTIPLQEFTGEFFGGLLGDHNGLVFFSPALGLPAADSVIQMDTVDVCTKAFDEYHFPQPLDPAPLMTYTPSAGVGTLNTAGFVLWGAFPRLSDAKFEIVLGTPLAPIVDTVDPFIDTSCVAVLTSTWPSSRVAILNSPDWKLYDNAGNPPAYFITANTLTPFPTPVSEHHVLSLTLPGGSEVLAAPDP